MPIHESGRTELGVPFDVRHERAGNRRYAFGDEIPRGGERAWILRTQAAERHREDRDGGKKRSGQWLHDSPPSVCGMGAAGHAEVRSNHPNINRAGSGFFIMMRSARAGERMRRPLTRMWGGCASHVSDATRSLRLVAKLSLSDVRPQPELIPFDTRLLPHFSTLGIPHEAPASRPRPGKHARIADGRRPVQRA